MMLDKPLAVMADINESDDEQNSFIDANDINKPQQSLMDIEVNWAKLKSGYGLLSIFGMVYWIINTIFAFIVQTKHPDQTWLFAWGVITLLIALCTQFALITMVISGYDDKTTVCGCCCINYNVKFEFPITTVATFPYSLLVCLDLFVHVGVTFLGNEYLRNGFSIVFIVCHGLNLLGLSYLDFEWNLGDKTFRIINFAFEWVDIASQVIVILVFSANSTAKNKDTIAKVYWAFTFFQLVFWIPPICLKISKNINILLHLIIILDLVTDVPIIITTIYARAYQVNFWILIDLIFKVLLTIRGVVYNVCVYKLLPYLVNRGRDNARRIYDADNDNNMELAVLSEHAEDNGAGDEDAVEMDNIVHTPDEDNRL